MDSQALELKQDDCIQSISILIMDCFLVDRPTAGGLDPSAAACITRR